MATRAFPVIYSQSVPDAARFYTRLGFAETFRLPPEGEPGYVSLRRGEAELGIVDASVADYREALIKAPQDMPWGERLAYVRDPDGNPVALAAPIRPS